jgi:hypothetical protein
MVNARQGPNNN